MQQEELLPLLLSRNQKGFNLLYDAYSKSLYAVIANLIKNQEEAEEVLQDVFVKIWDHIEAYDEKKGRLYTWMLNIARRTAIDKLRSKGYKNAQLNSNDESFVSLIDENSSFINKIDSIGIAEFVKKLKPKCIKIIDLLFFRGYTQQE